MQHNAIVKNWRGMLTEMRVRKLAEDERGDYALFAYRDMIYLFPTGQDISGQEIKKILDFLDIPGGEHLDSDEFYDASEIDEPIADAEVVDVVAGDYSENDNTLYLRETGGVCHRDPRGSVILKKIFRTLGLSRIILPSADDYTPGERVSGEEIKGKVPDVVYHGTTSDYLGNILKIGIVPGVSQSNYARQNVHHAAHTAEAVGGDPVIIGVAIPDSAKLVPDFDVDKAAENKHYPHIAIDIGIKVRGTTSMSASREFGIYGYRGRIPAKFVKEIYLVPNAEDEFRDYHDIPFSKYMDLTREEALAYLESKDEVGYGIPDPNWEEQFAEDEGEAAAYMHEWRKFELSQILNEQVTGRSMEAWNRLSGDAQDIVRAIAHYADKNIPVRIRYRPKVTTGKTVYRTVHPYSLRVRDVHINGYHRPKVPTVMFFGYDVHNKDNPNPGNEGPTIKNFVVDRIITVRPVRGKYQPKWPVELERERGEGEEKEI